MIASSVGQRHPPNGGTEMGTRASANAYKGGTRAILREPARRLREQAEALKRIG
jgi:hypothetical protein